MISIEFLLVWILWKNYFFFFLLILVEIFFIFSEHDNRWLFFYTHLILMSAAEKLKFRIIFPTKKHFFYPFPLCVLLFSILWLVLYWLCYRITWNNNFDKDFFFLIHRFIVVALSVAVHTESDLVPTLSLPFNILWHCLLSAQAKYRCIGVLLISVVHNIKLIYACFCLYMCGQPREHYCSYGRFVFKSNSSLVIPTDSKELKKKPEWRCWFF